MSDPIQFRFQSIQILSKNLISQVDQFDLADQQFIIKCEAKIQTDIKCVLILVEVNIANKSNSKILGGVTVVYYFEVSDFDKLIILNDQGLYVIPPDFLNTVQPACISTTRGIIYSEFRGTFLQNAIMPIIHMQDMKPEIKETN